MATTKGNRVLTSLYLDPSVAKELKELSASTRVPQAVYLREAVDLMLKHYRHVTALVAGGASEPPKPPPVLERLIKASHTGQRGKRASRVPAKPK